MVTMEVDRSAPEIDEVRYSRLIHAIGGREALDRLCASRVIVLGCRGLGAEVCKNLILSGVSSIALVDDAVVCVEDLGSNMLLKEADVGFNRAAAMASSLKELCPTADVFAIPETSLEATIKDFQVAVVTMGSMPMVTRINRLCREEGVMFVMAVCRGVFSYVFVDLGDCFTIQDESGEASEPVLIESITQDFPATISVVEEQRHGLVDEDEVTFSGIVGMEELNHRATYPVTVTGTGSFTIPEDTRHFERYVSGGYVHRKKTVRKLSFLPLEKSVLAPELCISDPTKAARTPHLHVAFQAVDEFERQRGCSLLGAGCALGDGDIEDVLKLAKDMYALARDKLVSNPLGRPPGVPEEAGPSDRGDAGVDEEIVRLVAQGGIVELCPIVSITGGIAAQEVIKALTKVFVPVHQWLYFDAVECLPSKVTPLEERTPQGSRYDCQSAVFGRDFQLKLGNSKWLVVGAGGIGCEVLKNLVMMGVGCGTNGRIVITDNDCVSKANLADQVLYRIDDLEGPKTPTAARALRKINPSAEIHSFQETFDSDNSTIFDSSFLDAMTGVLSAVDSSASRLYIDLRCVNSGRPMIDGGKHGTKGSVQVFVPFQSEMYASSRDPPEHKEVPICTLKNFPYATQHTLQWAVETFETLFKQRPADVNSYLSDREFQESVKKGAPSTRLPILETLRDALVRQRPLSFDACVQWARLQFEELFTNTIKQLLFNFPAGMTTSTGTPFWSGTKRIPTPLAFDPSDPLHLDFIIAASNLQATVYGLKGCRDGHSFIDIVQRVEVPDFQPREGVKIAVNDNELRANSQRGDGDAGQACEAILRELPTPSTLVGYRLSPLEFEKDDERSFHVDFITAAANLRACNYGIPLTSKLQARLVGGRVIPAVVTSTSVIGGLMCLELYKLLLEKPLADYKHSFFNLAVPLFCSSRPRKAVEHTVMRSQGGKLTWTLWDRLEMDCVGLSLEKFLANFKREQGLDVTMVSYGRSLLYAEFLPKRKLQDRLPMTLLELVTTVGKQRVPPSETKLVFSVSCTDVNNEDVEVPDVVAIVRW